MKRERPGCKRAQPHSTLFTAHWKKRGQARVAKTSGFRVGRDVIQQFLNAGLVDEFNLHTSPIIIGNGIRLLDKLDRKVFKVEVVETHQCSDVTHLKYRVINKKAKTLKKENES